MQVGSDKRENLNAGMEVRHPKAEGKTSFNFTVHLPEPPGHQAQPAPPKDLGQRLPLRSGPVLPWQPVQGSPYSL